MEAERLSKRSRGGSLFRASRRALFRVTGFAALKASGALAASPTPLAPAGPVGAADKLILLNSLVIMLVIVVPTLVAVLGFAWWFRASNPKARYDPDFVYSGRIELVVWAIPTLVIVFLGGLIWIGSTDLDPARPLSTARAPALTVQVVSLDWKWLFIYPDQSIATVNEAVLPVNVPVHFELTSGSVMNAFFVPRLGSMIYTMNGMRTQLYLQASRAGDYYGRSAHFSGDGFPGMEFLVHAVSPQDFESWTRSVKTKGPTLDAARYRALTRQSLDDAPMTFAAVDPGLFSRIVDQEIPPGPGPEVGEATNVNVRPGHR
jgi:cytochrome o ubiquinol oxidase subunit 2